ncbi:MAG: hypothetical protein JO163_03375 [Methylobacteriaceae bacterium]|nr:hypothetical protein [Methylobacteriaceae bacterium]MBV9634606.1 hypothetical protein [Methylobacteriaceae bacterium]MBV9701746.1 hypothetical protein [Methylobacteriaceae bacterium]
MATDDSDLDRARERARRFRNKASECYQLAENAHWVNTRQTYQRLALSYDRIADYIEQYEISLFDEPLSREA